MWGKNANFLGLEEFGGGQMKPREIHDPGTYYEYNDVRINRFALSLARVFGKGLPEVLKENIMDQIGASNEWKWQGYGPKSTVEINGKPVESVSGGTRWGGGLWINSQDLARFGLLILNQGKLGGQATGLGQVDQGSHDTLSARSGLRLSVVAEHEAEAVAQRSCVELRRRRQWRKHYLDRSRA